MFRYIRSLVNSTILFCFLFILGCDKDFEEVNTDPNSVSQKDFNPAFLLTTAELTLCNDFESSNFYGSTMMQQISALGESGSSWAEGDKYLYHQGHNNQLWSAQFDPKNGPVKLLQEIIESTREDAKYHNLHQMARILRVLVFQRLTDVYGDIPYFQSGLAFYGQVSKPQYDSQEAIYSDMLEELDDAVDKIQPGQNNFSNQDIIYKGDLGKWKRLGNSLMLRVGMRLSKADASKAELWVKKAFNKGVFTANGDNLFVKFTDKTGSIGILTNGLSETLRIGNPAAAKVSSTFFEFLKSHNDPRFTFTMGVYSDPYNVATGNLDPGAQKGMRNGLTIQSVKTEPDYDPNAPGAQNQYSGIRRDVYAKLDGIKMLASFAETQFLLAEAAVRNWISSDAKELYDRGVKAAMEMLSQYDEIASIHANEIDDYLNNYPFVGAANFEAAIEQINTQYWACTFLNGIETWANWRRTGFPKLIPINYPGNLSGGQIPRRLMYPQNERALNPDNYQAAVSRQGKDDFMSRVWWDKE
ncbi:MAG: SusD/RagB family nutrient-binding outer membrane lipoprotein [Chitinophagaceae bacterium]|nr:SusD/RagB family nutrient-binding outer membrane lipoprotein [Chitinophagaceae bacterium]